VPLHALGVDRPLAEIKADLFRSLAHPVRVRVLELLVDGPRPVSELLVELDVEASRLSQHLAVLRQNGVVTAVREGNAVRYSLAQPAVADLLAAARSVLVESLGRTRSTLTDLEQATRP